MNLGFLRQKLAFFIHGEGLGARAIRSSAYTLGGYMAMQVIRLGSNLILTRLLFPEAFGLMALVMLFLQGLQMFSDLGVNPSIMQSKRGDEPHFLNTAWTVQIARGVVLWLATILLAIPVSRFYNEPQLAQLLPVAGLALLISGFNSTRINFAHRHMKIGRVTLIEIISQIIGTLAMIAFALAFRSVWALLVSAIVSAIVKMSLSHLVLPGPSNRLLWERNAGFEIIHFGKWIFLSSVCGFILLQGDRMILGKYLSLSLLGIYNIGHFLASFPFMLGSTVVGKIMIPLYRDKHPSASKENFTKIRKMRFLLTGFIFALAAFMALAGVILTELLYDPRFHSSGAVLALVSVAQFPLIIGVTYDQAALAAGDSRGFFQMLLVRSVLLVAFLLTGMELGGLVPAILMIGLGSTVSHLFLIRLARRHQAWDALHDCIYFALAAVVSALALWLNQEELRALAGMR